MFFRTQRTLSENILMIFDPLPVKFLPQKKLLIWAKNSPIFCSKLPRSQKWRYQKFLLHQKMAKEGSKNQKKIFFRKNIRKMGKTNFGTSGTIIAKNRFWGGRTHGHFPKTQVKVSTHLCIIILILTFKFCKNYQFMDFGKFYENPPCTVVHGGFHHCW